MTIKIADYQNRPVQAGAEKSVARASDASSAPAEAVTVAGTSPVRITEQARQLASLEQAVQSRPVINEARVAEIRLAIEEGRYQINPERIADQLLRTEQELSAK